MAVVPPQSLRAVDIKDPMVLFERFNTEEIRGLERKIRGEIEQKKEELRQMVGERYRDLIDAADTISEMRECSESVVHSVQDMHRYCQKIKQGKSDTQMNSKEETQRQSQDRFYCMASQIKLLLEIPERIWSSMESSQFLQATQLYLLCCHLHSQLHLEAGGPHYSPVLTRFPILVRQMAAAGHFRSTILLDSKWLLRSRAVSDQAMAEALVSTMLLEDSSPRQALADFLLAKKASVHQLLNQPQHVAGIKPQVCSLIELLVTTLYQAYAVFYVSPDGSRRQAEEGLSCGLLFSTLENVTSTSPAGKGRRILQDEVSTGSWFKYLPPSISEFQPALRTLAQPIQREHLRDTLQQWIDTCKEDIKNGVSSLLVYVTSLKGLAAIRDAVWDLLSSASISQHWNTVSQRLLGNPLAVWEDFLQQLFLQRLQAIIQEGTEAICCSSKVLLSSSLRELERHSTSPVPTSSSSSPGSAPAPPPGPSLSQGARYEADVASFLWSEAQGDLLSDAAWISVSQRWQQQQRSGLAMKTQALTPCVQSFCSVLDGKLSACLDDLQHYLPTKDKAPDTFSTTSSNSAPSSFNRFTDTAAVEETLREHSQACIHHILACVRSELAKATKESPPHPAGLTSVLFMARLCQSMGELCPNLRQCILGKLVEADPVARGTPRELRKLGKAKALEVSPAQALWVGLKEELLTCSMVAYRIWSSALSKVLVERFSLSLHAESAGAILATATNWEELEIEEEAESGNRVTSKIRLPVQPSWFVQSLLFQLCLEVNRVGSHALPRPNLLELLQACLDQLLHEYEALLPQGQPKETLFPMTQNRALQMLFDLRYLVATLGGRLEEWKGSRLHTDPRIQQIFDLFEAYIDPFDLDVFTLPLNKNLSRLSQRTAVLLGLLTSTEKQFVSGGNSGGSQEANNILPVASCQIRFGLLPLSMSNSGKAKSSLRSTDKSRHLAPFTGTPASDDSFSPGNLFRQLAKQEEEPAATSLFKLGWLSGMSK